MDTDIINSTPTILAMMGIRIPRDMEGSVIAEAFDPPLVHERETEEAAGKSETGASQPSPDPNPVYSPEEMAKLTERLADLGYLE